MLAWQPGGRGWRSPCDATASESKPPLGQAPARPWRFSRMNTTQRMLLVAVPVAGFGAWLCLLLLERSYEQPYCLIEDGLFIGSSVNQPPLGIKAVVNLCGREDPYQVDASLWEPVFEGSAEPNLEWLGRVVEFIAVQRQAGRPTYVHCLAGMNRSGAVVTAYLMHEHGWGRDDALAFVREKRPVVQPNPTLMRLLAEWENALKDKKAMGR
jgi:protein-tyrosine phosphatase